MKDILERLKELYVEATEERTHFYVGNCIKRDSAMCSADKLAQNLIRSRNLWI